MASHRRSTTDVTHDEAETPCPPTPGASGEPARSATARGATSTLVACAAAASALTFVSAGAAPAAALAAARTAPAWERPHAPSTTGADTGRQAQLRRRIAVLNQRGEAEARQYAAIEDRIEQQERDLATERARTAAVRAELDNSEDRLGTVAAAQYRSGDVSQALNMMLADRPAQYLQQVLTLNQIAHAQAASIHVAIQQQHELTALRKHTRAQVATLRAERDTLADRRDELQRELDQARRLLDSLTRPAEPSSRPSHEPSETSGHPRPGLADLPTSGRALAAVAAAYAQIGKPYVYGATGPGSFDCSGLTQYVWRIAGVELPRTSQEQARAGHVVSVSRAEPGDLVIYYRGASHVAIYVGHGKIIQAPHPGASVQVASMRSMPIDRVVRP